MKSIGRLPQTALMYDFDKTLSTHDMQDYAFIPSLGQSPEAFWRKAAAHGKSRGMDNILSYMYAMMKEARAAGKPIRKETLEAMGRSVVLFPGVAQWFDRIRLKGQELGLDVRHYIISSGVREIILGTPIARHFDMIYACEYHYDENGEADWPANAVNYTGKTQYLFRINKGVLDVTNVEDLNRYTPEEERPIPFPRMIFIGDGLTDIPIMRLTRRYGGRSLAVYTQEDRVRGLLKEGRVDAIVPADYREGSPLDRFVMDRLWQIARGLREDHP